MKLMNELRMGNWVNFNGVQGLEPLQIQRYHFFLGYSKTLGAHTLDPHDFWDKVTPIPLDDKWFKLYGFTIETRHNGKLALLKREDYKEIVYHFDLWKGNGWDCWVFDTVDDRGDENMVSVELRYVHRLQNLFFELYDKELEFVLL